jgi:hypothetical protein
MTVRQKSLDDHGCYQIPFCCNDADKEHDSEKLAMFGCPPVLMTVQEPRVLLFRLDCSDPGAPPVLSFEIFHPGQWPQHRVSVAFTVQSTIVACLEPCMRMIHAWLLTSCNCSSFFFYLC